MFRSKTSHRPFNCFTWPKNAVSKRKVRRFRHAFLLCRVNRAARAISSAWKVRHTSISAYYVNNCQARLYLSHLHVRCVWFTSFEHPKQFSSSLFICILLDKEFGKSCLENIYIFALKIFYIPAFLHSIFLTGNRYLLLIALRWYFSKKKKRDKSFLDFYVQPLILYQTNNIISKDAL